MTFEEIANYYYGDSKSVRRSIFSMAGSFGSWPQRRFGTNAPQLEGAATKTP